MKLHVPLAPSVALVALVAPACGSSSASSDGQPSVVAALYPLAYVAERVAGDNASVANLTAPGVESHDLELTGQQVGEVVDADLVVFLPEFQPAVDDAIEQNAADSSLDVSSVVEMLDETASDDEHHDEDEHNESGRDHDHGDRADPHFWLDPTRLVPVAEAVADRLAEIDPDNTDAYLANAANVIADLEELDSEFSDDLAQCDRDVFVTSHEAFGYLADRYGLEQVGIAGIDPDAEPSPERLAAVHDVVTDLGVTTIFYERLASPKVAETLAADLGVNAAVLDPIEGLTDDTADEDYLSLMRANLAALHDANGCS